jgi:hypothetical protein
MLATEVCLMRFEAKAGIERSKLVRRYGIATRRQRFDWQFQVIQARGAAEGYREYREQRIHIPDRDDGQGEDNGLHRGRGPNHIF